MSLLIQHGWGKSDKIETALSDGSATGVIMSPRDENPDNLRAFLSQISGSFPDSTRLFDPQFYVTTVVPARDGNLPDYPYYRPNLTRRDFIGAAKYQKYAGETLDYQYDLDVTAVISPTVEIVNFGDSSSQIALQLADASCEYHAGHGEDKPLLLSFLIDEPALEDTADLDMFLDAVTLMEADGVYLVAKRTTSTHTPQFVPERMRGLMYIVHIFRVINRYDVYSGYSDLVSLPLHAAGATSTACGWSGTLRRFTFNRFRPSRRGGRARSRYLSSPVIESILVDDLDTAFEVGMIEALLSDTSYDGVFRTTPPSRVSWPNTPTGALHHWQALSTMIGEIEPMTVQDALKRVEYWIDLAEATLYELGVVGVELEPPTGDHLSQWRAAINEFRGLIGLSD